MARLPTNTILRSRAPARGFLDIVFPVLIVMALMSTVSADSGEGRHQMPEQGRTLWMHSDGTYESCYAAEWPECVPPDYGSFAEHYEGSVRLLAIVIDLTYFYDPVLPVIDIYVWSDDAGHPGSVLALLPDCWVYGNAWPAWNRNTVDVPAPICTGSEWWAGFWGPWPDMWAQFGICADLNGPGGGTPMYKIAPGLEWPEGWQNIDVRWPPTSALGIGAEIEETPSPVTCATWGAIKQLFRTVGE